MAGKEETDTSSALDLFHPLIAEWFLEAQGPATEIQSLSWPVIAAGKHLLMSAPTGSGKTLSAFLWALNCLIKDPTRLGTTRVLYVSPLKALGNDIERNLVSPLADLRAKFAGAGASMPEIRVATRSGDTSASERRRLLSHPPEILITTPESLNLMLSTRPGRNALAGVDTLIVDEIHAIAGNRRGVLLTTAAERLVEIAGEAQRIALSATVHPLKLVADWIGGRDTRGARRVVHCRTSTRRDPPDLQVCFPANARASAEPIWKPLARSLKSHMAPDKTSLVFVNGRSLAEKLALDINRLDEHSTLSYAHHGSLARETRLAVETRLKRGELRAVIATSTLEMGIDIGSLDEVLLVQSPPSVTSAVQRIGRAGHRVGEISRATLYPVHGQDFVSAAALSRLVRQGQIEPLAPIKRPLDILAQIIVSMTASEALTRDEILSTLTRSEAYADLSRTHFDAVLEMLFARSANHRLRELKVRLQEDEDGRLCATRGAVMDLYASGGAIPDRGYYAVKHLETGASLGELDEEFVWEARTGQVFSLGSMNWQVQRITDAHVHVLPAKSGPQLSAPPFWRADSGGRSVLFSQAIGEFLEDMEQRLSQGSTTAEALCQHLGEDYSFDPPACQELVSFLTRQREATGCPLPHSHHLLAEIIPGVAGGRGAAASEMRSLLLHTLWGGRVNAPLAVALGKAIEKETGTRPDVIHDDNTIAVLSASRLSARRLLGLVTPENLDDVLRESLEASGMFGARFRECAGRSLLITKRHFGDRLPLWVSRLQAKKLMNRVRGLPDFPMMLEAWRSCLEDEFDLETLRSRLEAVRQGEIKISEIHAKSPSPFALSVTWAQINERYMYADDTPESRQASALEDDLIRSLRIGGELAVSISDRAIQVFLDKRQRLEPGYAPRTQAELQTHLRERVMLPLDGWHALAERLRQEAPGIAKAIPKSSSWRILGGRRFLVHHSLPANAFSAEDITHASAYLSDLLSFHGPLTLEEICELAPLPKLEPLIEECLRVANLRRGYFRQDVSEPQYCDSENLESLIRIGRSLARSRLKPRPACWLPAFLSAFQGGRTGAGQAELLDSLGALRGYSAPVETWLQDLLPCRHEEVSDRALDQAMEAAALVAYGTGSERMSIAARDELEVLHPSHSKPLILTCFTDPNAKYEFLQLHAASGLPLAEFNKVFWQAVWQSQISSDRLDTLREGLRRGFALGIQDHPRSARRGSYRFRPHPVSWQGNFSRLPQASKGQDALDRLESAKERARALLDRYGIVTREIANRETSAMRWQEVFRALRLLELAGEVTSGLFFEGLTGPQFALPEAVDVFQNSELLEHQVRWCAALDPISPSGLDIAFDGAPLPRRVKGNHLLVSGNQVLASWSASGSQVRFATREFSARETGELRSLVTHLLHTRGTLTLRQIDGASPLKSDRLKLLEPEVELVREPRAVSLQLPAGG